MAPSTYAMRADWKSNNLSGWIEKLHPNAVRPIQQFAYTTAKNATDSATLPSAFDTGPGSKDKCEPERFSA